MAEATKKKATRTRRRSTKTSSTKTGTTHTSNELTSEERNELPKETFAFPKERKEPLNDASHVRNAVARFDQVTGVSDRERDAAWKRIKAAAKRFDVEIEAERWQDLGGDKP